MMVFRHAQRSSGPNGVGCGRAAPGAVACLAWLACSCAEPALLSRPAGLPSEQQAHARVHADPLEPLVIEWPASERAELEARLKSGLVVVRYDGRTMDVLRHCRIAGEYAFNSTSVHRDHLVIEDQDALRSQLPLGAARLSATLRQTGRLEVRLAVVGTYRTANRRFRKGELEGDCDGASHVVSSVAVGAFELKAGGTSDVQHGATLVNLGATSKHESSHETLSSAGQVATCERESGEHAAPPEGCGALVRLGLAVLRRDPEPVVAPPAEPPGPAEAPPSMSSAPAAAASAPALAPLPAPRTSRQPPEHGIAGPSGEALVGPAQGSSSEPPSPARTSPWVYVGAGTALAVLIGLAVAAAVVKKDEPTPRPAPTGGLGNTSLPLGLSW
jgi:hypothetical protein